MRQTISIFLACAALWVSPARAQSEQTPGGAMQFFETVIAQKQVRGSYQEGGIWDPSTMEWTESGQSRYGEGRNIREIGTSTIQPPCTMILGLKTPEPRIEREGALKETFPDAPPIILDFSRISEVQTSGKYVRLIGASPPFRIFVYSESLRPRVAYAAEFLRQHCDKAAVTGF